MKPVEAEKFMEGGGRAVVLVWGDLGRSPRMQRQALMMARSGEWGEVVLARLFHVCKVLLLN
ncbi:MAG: hypothetical protein AAF591_21315 [Verrucomicrobiota bacterium]